MNFVYKMIIISIIIINMNILIVKYNIKDDNIFDKEYLN